MQPAQLVREVWFWSGVFRDHATFIYDNLAPEEAEAINWAKGFQQAFGSLHDDVERLGRRAGLEPAGSYALRGSPPQPPEVNITDAQAVGLRDQLLELLGPFRMLKQQILQLMIDCKVKLQLTPTLVQHMINEANECFRVLDSDRKQEPPPMEMLHLHRLWLSDASGHAATLNSRLDPTEQKLAFITRDFQRIFDGMHIKALELQTMLAVAPRLAGALQQLTWDAATKVAAFREFLMELRGHLEGCRVLGPLMPLMADHMAREELYYMEKLLEARSSPAQA